MRQWTDKSNSFGMFLLLLLFSPLSFAFTEWLRPITNFFHLDSQCMRPIATLTGGSVSATKVGRSQTFPIIDSSMYAYSAHHTDETRPAFGGFVGAEWLLDPRLSMQAGVGYYEPSHFVAKGALTQGPDAESSDTYNYQYQVITRQLLAEGKWLYHGFGRFHPYLGVGLGGAINTAHQYHVSYPRFLTFTPLFKKNTEGSFSYQVGLGMDIDVIKHLRLGIGYRFSDLGKTKLGKGHIDTVRIINTLKQSHLYAHEALAQLTFVM